MTSSRDKRLRPIDVPAEKINLEFVLGNKVMVGSVTSIAKSLRSDVLGHRVILSRDVQ